MRFYKINLKCGQNYLLASKLNLGGDIGIPVIAALSVGGDGRGLVCGLAARMSSTEAARAAVTELCQMEMGLLLATAKRQQLGAAALSDIDRRHIERSTTIDAAICDLLHPKGEPREWRDEAPCCPSDCLDLAVSTLANRGLSVALVDLTRAAFGIPVVKAVAPRLQLLPSGLTTKRLGDTIACTGGGVRWTGGVPLT